MSKGLERSIARGGLFDMTIGQKTETGRTSADNRPIFREVFLLADTAAGVDQNFTPDGVIDFVVAAYGGTKNVAGKNFAIPFSDPAGDTLNIGLTVNIAGTSFDVETGTAAELQGGHVVVEYTE